MDAQDMQDSEIAGKGFVDSVYLVHIDERPVDWEERVLIIWKIRLGKDQVVRCCPCSPYWCSNGWNE